jgi:hypothetical protein
MTLQELRDSLAQVRKRLEAENVDEAQRLELEILEKQIQMQIVVGTFDPLKELDGLGGVDVSKLKSLIPEVDRVIKQEQERAKLVGRIIGMAKTALRAAGVPVI